MSLFLIVICFTIVSPFLNSQSDTAEYNTEDVLDDLLQETQDTDEESGIYDVLEDLILNPVDINKADISQLQRIPYIDYVRAELIVNHRKKYGVFYSVQELFSVENLSNEIVGKILPFVTLTINTSELSFDEDGAWDSFAIVPGIKMRNRVTTDLQNRKGFSDGGFEGSKYKIYNRILLNGKGKYQIGVLTEKDAGEKPIDEFDSYHLTINEIGPIENFIAGDFLLENGQGLVLWSPYGLSKGSDAVYPIKKIPKIIKAYTSATENNFFRGTAAKINWNDFTFVPFFSKNKLDANIEDGFITSTPVDGLHRTEGEINRRKTLTETSYGSILRYNLDSRNNISALYYRSSYSSVFLPDNVYDISGNKFDYYSVSYDLYFGNLNVSGEAAYNSISVATINNFQFAFTRDFIFITSIRNYPRNYFSLHGFALAERSGTIQNEFAIYNGFRWKSPIGILNFYYDQFKFPYSLFNTPLPSGGNEILADLTSSLSRSVEGKARYKYEKKDISINDGQNRNVGEQLKQNYRMEVIYTATKKFRLRTRFEYNTFLIKGSQGESGFLFFEDLKYSFTGLADISARIIFFKTDSFNSALYEYENDLTGVMYNPALFGEGLRWYLVGRIKPFKIFTISFKYSETYKPNEKKLSSGNSEIDGNVDNRFSLQLDLNF
ncbi:MAG: helix-hairpin-helix domain-containing protein [Ignavibacteriales bacterium]|nr:MAG: helix-hairpin-helix domain-containing protein [Ignavibacteriales bacterium]